MYTPGPWNIYKGMDAKAILDSGWVLVVHHGDGGNIVANVNAKGGPDYTDRMPVMANAHLIAAAPDLLEACEDARRELTAQAECFGNHLDHEKNLFRILRKLESVIAKAKGA